MISFIDIFYNFSLFKMHPYLYYKNELTFFSLFSYILTVIFGIGLLFIVMLILNKTDYRIISSKYDDFKNKVDLTTTPFLIKLIDKNGTTIEQNDRIYKFIITSVTVPSIRDDSSEKIKYKAVKIINCSYDDPNMKNYYMTYNISEYICVDYNEDRSVYGKYLDNNNGYKYYSFQIEKCVNNLNNNICDNEGIKRLEESELIIEYLDYKIYNEEKNNENVKLMNRQKKYKISTNLFKQYAFFINTGYYEIKGYNFFTSKSFNYNYLSSINEFDIELINNNSTLIGQIIMASQGEITTTTKEYTSILEQVSYISGWTNLLFFFLEFLNKIFYIRIYKLDLFSNFIDGDKYAYKKSHSQLILYRRDTLQDNRYTPITKEYGENMGNLKLKVDRKNTKIIHISTEHIKSKFNYIIPYCCFKMKKKYIRFFLYDKILCQYLSLESIYSTVISVNKYKSNEMFNQPFLNNNMNKIPVLRNRDNNTSQVFNHTRDQFIYNLVSYSKK